MTTGEAPTFLRKARAVLGDALSHFNDDDGWAMSSHVALSALMAVFPFLIFVGTLAAFIGDAGLADRVADLIFNAWPPEVAKPIAAQVHLVLSVHRGGLLTISILITVYLASNGVEAVRTAQINLGYASVTSPIAGRIGRALVTEGALVGQGEATPLAVVQQIDPVYVNFTQSAADVFQLRRAMESGQFKRADNADAASVRLVLGDGSEYGQPGKLLFTDLSVDSTTGQVTLRAEVPNPKGELLPGLYVRVRIEQAQARNAITLPQQAVTRTQQGDTVSVVGEDGKVSQRPIKVSTAQNNRWVVLDGLKAGEKVMVDGFQKLQMLPPGTPVKPVPWQAPGATPGAAAAPATAPAASAASAPNA